MYDLEELKIGSKIVLIAAEEQEQSKQEMVSKALTMATSLLASIQDFNEILPDASPQMQDLAEDTTNNVKKMVQMLVKQVEAPEEA